MYRPGLRGRHRTSENGARPWPWSWPTRGAVAPFSTGWLGLGFGHREASGLWGTLSLSRAGSLCRRRLKASPSHLRITSGDRSSQGQLVFPSHSRACLCFPSQENQPCGFCHLRPLTDPYLQLINAPHSGHWHISRLTTQ